jgi:hypothetical protein
MSLEDELGNSPPRTQNALPLNSVTLVEIAAMVPQTALQVLALLVLLPIAAIAQTSGFGALAGSWSGSGSVTLASGGVERIRCQATYEVAPSGENFQQNLRCRSDSYNFNLRSSVLRSGDSVAGTWTETTRNVDGRISGRIGGNQIQATIQGPGFSANLAMTTQGDRQTVSIRSQGTEFATVSIALRRGG